MWPLNRNHHASIDRRDDKRARKRSRLQLKGTIFLPDKECEATCFVSDMSPDGAGLKSACSAAIGTDIVLYVQGLGRFEGTIIHRDRLRVGVKFNYSKLSRMRIAEQIAMYLEHGPFIYTSMRSRPRLTAKKMVHSFALELETGQKQVCDVVDITFIGASLKTDTRPEVGERVMFGKTPGVVVRHTEDGFAISFGETGARVPAAFNFSCS
jgi:hypothetical protein